ncbi:hypothetical protein [Tomitella gaofuii]|uniref:hypothetical protein n=1 Tax=Tomitella gaofuii TaxID=2760083 RepID=UPI0015FB261E|nr:hypothetical protein [Tomitella gaofuii]
MGPTLFDFWRWYVSNLLDNATRGVVAEFLVGTALDCVEGIVRTEWDAYDLRAIDGITVEVKSASHLRSWHQSEPTRVSFGVGPTFGWGARTNAYSTERRRQADVYVFCLLHHLEKSTVDPLNTDQWTFYVALTTRLDAVLGSQASIT